MVYVPFSFVSKFLFMQTKIGIKPENLDKIIKPLCHILADEFVLYVKTLNAHWNIEGNDFYNKHLFFETQYKELSDIIDSVAERIRSLGHYAPATIASYLELTHLTEQSRKRNDSTGFLELLLEDHDAIIMYIRGYINYFSNKLKDAGTSDFITNLLEKHETMSWKLRAHLAWEK
jgi:starvation-inducible DNA-binding protein